MSVLIKGGRIIDPANKIDGISDLLVSDGRIEALGQDITDKAAAVIDAKGMIVSPGFVDMHAHLREPGREDEETISSGTRAAIRGGFTSVACMPNTDPAIDSPDIVRMVKGVIAKDALCNVFVVGAVSSGRQGKALADIAGMSKEGVVAVSDDGSPVEDEAIMLSALKACKRHGIPLIDHCENKALSGKGVMNKGFVSSKMGLRGIPKESEYGAIKRDIELAKRTGAWLHIAHVSCEDSVDIIRKAKKQDIGVTCETAPHYFSLTDECCVTYDTNTKMNPPLREKRDVEAIKEGLADGTIDAIATDHAPHTDSEKYVEFDFAPFGIIGLETALGLSVIELVDKNILSWSSLIAKLSSNPASILKTGSGGLKKGSPADITLIDPAAKYIYKRETIESKSKNSPFIDWELKGKVVSVLVGGRQVMKNGEIL